METASPSEASDQPQQGDPEINERGNAEVSLGQALPLTAPGGDTLGTFTVDRIDVIPLPCPTDNEFQESVPQNGHFIRVDIRAATGPADPSVTVQASISSTNFRYIKADGVTFGNTDMGTFPAFSCLPQEQQFPSGGLGPGQQFVGSIVLDVPDTDGILIFLPSGGFAVGQELGYEFQL
ncbi:hypothetical protein E4P40_12440 [Blastococcus sp. CT_GayMR20]|uniref:hypothetical protein n=1 Tax=Blastococcus sp. CT_GayMR20 TaxID=2559609 RepID=UPI001072FBC0|nr:hypothetical protein [Blastococcus sp. CT_GayMR20]TFV86723.1 hypothetical protein E4P40_12440 [Blastococcus sp. CT_GayMR20]